MKRFAEFLPELPRVEQIIACRAEQCISGKCGKPTVVIGYETAEQLDRGLQLSARSGVATLRGPPRAKDYSFSKQATSVE